MFSLLSANVQALSKKKTYEGMAHAAAINGFISLSATMFFFTFIFACFQSLTNTNDGFDAVHHMSHLSFPEDILELPSFVLV